MRTLASRLGLSISGVLLVGAWAALAVAQPTTDAGMPAAVGPESPAVGPESPVAGGEGETPDADADAPPSDDPSPEPAASDEEAPAAQPAAAESWSGGSSAASDESEASDGYDPDANPQRTMRLATGDLLTLRASLFEFTFGGLLQVWAVPFVGDDASRTLGAPVDTEGFVLRRARFGVRGSILTHTTFELVWDFVDSRLDSGSVSTGRVYEAEIGYRRLEFAELGFGIRRVPFARADLAPSWGLEMTDVPYALHNWHFPLSGFRTIVPPRSVGATISGRLPMTRYALGLYNASGSPSAGPDSAGFIGAARLEIAPLGAVTDYQGPRIPQDPAYDEPRVSLGVGSYLWGDTPGNQLGVTADLVFQWNRIYLEGAFVWSAFRPDETGFEPSSMVLSDTTQMAFHGQLGVWIFPGYLELATRFEAWNPRTEDTDRTLSAIRGALNYYFIGHRIKAQLEYTHRMESGTSADDDQLVLGLSLRL